MNNKRKRNEMQEVGPTTFKSTMIVNDCLRGFFRPYIEKRQKDRIFFEYDKDTQKWFTYQQDDLNKKLLATGTYAYVVHTEETVALRKLPGNMVGWSINKGEHNKTFHIGLSDLAEVVVAAGEAEFKNGNLKYFDRGSGNYNPTDVIQFTAGLPADKYRKLTYTP